MNLLDRAKNMLLAPAAEWAVIEQEEANAGKVFLTYVLPWAMIHGIAAYLGHTLVLGPYHYGTLAAQWGLRRGLRAAVSYIFTAWVSTICVYELAPVFSSQKNIGRAMQAVAYASTGLYIGGVLSLIPLAPIRLISWLLSLYCVYFFYLGLPVIMKTPEEKIAPYMIVASLSIVALYLVFVFSMAQLW